MSAIDKDHFVNKALIGGEWVEGVAKLVVLNPADFKMISSVHVLGRKQVLEAISAAQDAFLHWSKTTAYYRAEILSEWGRLIKENMEYIALLITLESGKNIKESRNEVTYALSFIHWFVEAIKHCEGDIIPSVNSDNHVFVKKMPLGVIAAITPWNFPAAMVMRKLGAALAAGCTIILKPDEKTPLTALKLAQLAQEAGMPPGVINVVIGDPSDIGQIFTSHSAIKCITFTGSSEVGKLLTKQASHDVKKVILELGGNAPFIVTKNANLDLAVSGLIHAKFRNNGQTCVAANRIFVHEKVMLQFTNMIKKRVSCLKIGNGLEPENDLGPLISGEAVDRFNQFALNAKVVGNKVSRFCLDSLPSIGYFVPPIVVSGDNMQDADCFQNEVFGPIIGLQLFSSIQEVIESANDSAFGLAAYCYTDNIREIWEFSENLDYGIIGINESVISGAAIPFGGVKHSGLGREGGLAGLEEFLASKVVNIKFC